jgi:hypothetical protein
MSDLYAGLTVHLDTQHEVGWDIDWPEALAAIRAVIELHKPDSQGDCNACISAHEDPVPFPCDTVKEIADALGPDVWHDFRASKDPLYCIGDYEEGAA